MQSADIQKLNELLEPDNRKTRQSLRDIFKDPIFIPRYDVSLRYERELALERLLKISQAKVFSVTDFETNPLNIFAGKEIGKYILI